MRKKISDLIVSQKASGNRQLKGLSSGIWETSEIVVENNEIDNFCYVLLFPSDKDVYSSGCTVPEFQLCFAFTGQSHQWKFKKNTIVHYFIIGKSIIDNIPFLSSPSITRSNILKGIIYARIAIIFAETCRFLSRIGIIQNEIEPKLKKQMKKKRNPKWKSRKYNSMLMTSFFRNY
jgi:hypothetical protein